MDYKKYFTEDQKTDLELSSKYAKSIPSVKIELLLELFNNKELPDLERLTLALLTNVREAGKYIEQFRNLLTSFPKETLDGYYSMLTPVDQKKASVIFVYGTNKSNARAIHAAEIYKQMNVPIIISDAEVSKNYEEILVDKAVSKENIFLEENGKSFIQNAYYSIDLAKQKDISIENVAVVSASLVALRGVLATKIFLPENTEVYSLPVEYDKLNPNDPTSPENWYKNDLGIKVFLSEIVKLYIMRKEGILK